MSRVIQEPKGIISTGVTDQTVLQNSNLNKQFGNLYDLQQANMPHKTLK
jgi:hypothetical protein